MTAHAIRVAGAIVISYPFNLGYGVWMLVISKVKSGEAFSASGAFFNILLALSSWWFFNETLTLRQWLGMVVITCGVLLVTLPPR